MRFLAQQKESVAAFRFQDRLLMAAQKENQGRFVSEKINHGKGGIKAVRS